MVSFVVWDHVRCYRQFSTKQERETRQSPRVETSEFRQGLLSVCHSRNKANSEQALDNCIIMLSLMNQKKYKCKFLLYRCNGENLLIFTYTHKTRASTPRITLPTIRATGQFSKACKLRS
jgi:hypothetical protein